MGSSIGLSRGPIAPVFVRYISSANSRNLVTLRMLWSVHLSSGTFPSMPSTVMVGSRRYRSVISILSGVFLFYIAMNVPASPTFAPSSFSVKSSRSVMSQPTPLCVHETIAVPLFRRDLQASQG
jgi:hypothetical protein